VEKEKKKNTHRLMKQFKAIVVGAGPAGVCAIGNLLDSKIYPILWVDPKFNAGRLSSYQSVPSNTKTSLFIEFALATNTFRTILDKTNNHAIAALRKLRQDKGCDLKHACSMTIALTEGIKRYFSDKVDFKVDTLQSLQYEKVFLY
jgi:hypothetical protein